ncbi:MAG: hypothetical protein R3E53_05000 [Myxococcota bacterium]
MVGELASRGLAFQFSDTSLTAIQFGPALVGEHTREILAELGYDAQATEALFASRAVGDETVYPALAKAGASHAKSPWEP